MAYEKTEVIKAKIAENERAAEHFRGMIEASTSVEDRSRYDRLAGDHDRHVGNLQRIIEIREEDRIARQIARQDRLVFGLDM